MNFANIISIIKLNLEEDKKILMRKIQILGPPEPCPARMFNFSKFERVRLKFSELSQTRFYQFKS